MQGSDGWSREGDSLHQDVNFLSITNRSPDIQWTLGDAGLLHIVLAVIELGDDSFEDDLSEGYFRAGCIEHT